MNIYHAAKINKSPYARSKIFLHVEACLCLTLSPPQHCRKNPLGWKLFFSSLKILVLYFHFSNSTIL